MTSKDNKSNILTLELTGTLTYCYFDELLRRANIADGEKSIVSQIYLTDYLIYVCYRSLSAKENENFYYDRDRKVFDMTKYYLEVIHEQIDEINSEANHVIWKYLCYLYEAQIDLLSGNFNGALENYFKFTNFSGVIRKRGINCHFDYEFEVIHNVVKMGCMCEEYDIASQIANKYEYLLLERVNNDYEKTIKHYNKNFIYLCDKQNRVQGSYSLFKSWDKMDNWHYLHNMFSFWEYKYIVSEELIRVLCLLPMSTEDYEYEITINDIKSNIDVKFFAVFMNT